MIKTGVAELVRLATSLEESFLSSGGAGGFEVQSCLAVGTIDQTDIRDCLSMELVFAPPFTNF